MQSMQWPGDMGKQEAENRKTLALMGAFCLFLSAIEYMIPKPFPFMRTGIANLPLMMAVDILPFSGFLVLAGIKIVGQALVTGTLFSYVFLFSLAGVSLSALAMYALRRFCGRKRLSFIGLGVAGAMISNTSQLILAWVFVFGNNARYIAPPFLAAGLVSGLVLGSFCEYFTNRSQWYAASRRQTGDSPAADAMHGISMKQIEQNVFPGIPSRPDRNTLYENLFSSRSLCIAGLLIMPAFLLNPVPLLRVVQFLFFWLLCRLSGRKDNPLITLTIISGIVIFNLLVPYGRVLFSIGTFKITSGALAAGIQRAVTLEGLIMLSRVCIRRDLKIPGVLGDLISESFRIFARIMDSKPRISGRNFVRELDGLLLELSGEESPPVDEKKPVQKTKAAGFIILAAVIILSYLPGVLGYVN